MKVIDARKTVQRTVFSQLAQSYAQADRAKRDIEPLPPERQSGTLTITPHSHMGVSIVR